MREVLTPQNKLLKRWRWPIGFATLLLTVIIYWGLSEIGTPALNSISTRSLYASAWPDAQGKTQAVNQWHNRVSVVNFWASWCQPCRDEMPDLSAVYNKYASKGLVVLGISVEDQDKMTAFASKNNVSYPLLAADTQGSDLSDTLGNDKGVLPYTAIIDVHGKVVKTFSGTIDQATLEAAVLPLMTTP
jgi:thiol-disulfide isomerase/thioredoxin